MQSRLDIPFYASLFHSYMIYPFYSYIHYDADTTLSIRHKNISREIIIRMEHPYRIHSSIGFGFLQLLMLSSLAYPTPPPPLYHNIALIRMMGTVYFTLFHDKPIYLKLECLTILLEVIRDTLYIWYIIQYNLYHYINTQHIVGIFFFFNNHIIC